MLQQKKVECLQLQWPLVRAAAGTYLTDLQDLAILAGGPCAPVAIPKAPINTEALEETNGKRGSSFTRHFCVVCKIHIHIHVTYLNSQVLTTQPGRKDKSLVPASMGLLQERVEQTRGKQLQRPTFTKEDYDELCKNSRLSLPPFLRIPIAAFAGFSIGMSLGLSYGSKMAGLRFRAEHAHKLPNTTAGWYMYHKSKNYHLAFGGIKEGIKTGMRMSVLTAAMFCAENLFDVYRGSKDLFNTVGASLAVAGGFSLLSTFGPLALSWSYDTTYAMHPSV